jgi:gamma-glutamyltranspeptidase/glutathione hydrolase
MMPSLLSVALLLVQAATQDSTPAARNPAYSRDGRLAVSVEGDLWVVSKAGQWSHVTSGPAWDREPAWTPDGKSLVFSSDRSGNFDLWTVAAEEGAQPTRVTTSPLPEGEPTVGLDGKIYFVRGRLGAAALWTHDTNGNESRVTKDRSVERWPTISPDGNRLAYVAISGGTHKLHVRTLDGSRDSIALTDARIEHPAWSPAGDRLSWTATGARGSVYVTSLDGKYVNVVSARHAESAWNPDGKTIALADIPANDAIPNVNYNGDPDRTGDRDANLLAASNGKLWTVDAPTAPDARLAQYGAPGVEDRTRRNADAFDQVWNRTASLYYSTSDATARLAQWEALKTKYRARAIAATTDDELKATVHDLLREHPPFRQSAAGRAAVSSAHPVATAAGTEILAKGGNVVDAAVAVSFALGVVEPDASGIGGYGQMLIYQKGMDRPQLIEFMTRVPEDANDMPAATPGSRREVEGAALVNVPGTLAAMYLAWQKYGSKKLTWSDLVQPAIRAAREGYIVSEGLATTLATEREQFLKSEGARVLFFRDDVPLKVGDTIRNLDLANTLEAIAKGGADALYKGDIGKKMVSDLHAHGNPMKLTDLSRYYAAERVPIMSTYRDYTLFTPAPPVSGGAELSAKLNMLELYPNPKPYTEDAGTLHAMIAAWQLIPSTRNRIADPGLWPTNIEPFTNKDTARIRWRCFTPDKALTSSSVRGDTLVCSQPETKAVGGKLVERDVPPACLAHGYDYPASEPCRSAGTTSFSIADADGNVVATTQTLGTWGGNFYVTPGLGFLYNDKLTSFGGNADTYGSRLPVSRGGSTITPTIVMQGSGKSLHPVMAFGAAGNEWITPAVYQVFVGMADDKLDPQAALELPRFSIGGFGGGGRGGNAGGETKPLVRLEDGFAPSVTKRLEEIGYRLQFVSLPGELREGYGSAVKIDKGKVTAGADPRRAGAAGAVP